MVLINIIDSNDNFNRYKMEKLESKNQLNKTYLVNIDKVSRDLKTTTNYIIKNYEYQLGTRSCYDKKRNEYYLCGLYNNNNLTLILNDFIKKYLICTACNLPEITFLLEKKLCFQCSACGIKTSSNDSKLTNYIIKHMKN